MRYGRHLPALLALPSLALASFPCKDRREGVTFDFSALGGSHSITLEPKEDFPFTINTTWTINPCGPIGKKKGIPAEDQCPSGTQVCGIERLSEGEDSKTIVAVMPIAGDIDGRHTDEQTTRLKTSEAHADQGKEGLRVVLHGGLVKKHKQQAIIEFICDPERTGLEGDETDDTKKEGDDKKEEDDKKKEGDDKKDEGEGKEKREAEKDRSLKYVSYDTTNEVHTLRLEWKTKYACESLDGGDGTPVSGSSWGFFTWFIIILFLGVAAYLIFGSWMNYNMYGARGLFTTNARASWDLLPHSDTIRDVPYLLKDWARRVIGTLQGRDGGRGGYSAV